MGRRNSLRIEVCILRTSGIKTRCARTGGKVGDVKDFTSDGSYFGIALQYPSLDGGVHDHRSVVEKAKQVGIRTVVCADILALTLLTPPGEWGADVCVGNTQRFGVPMGYGGPMCLLQILRIQRIFSADIA